METNYYAVIESNNTYHDVDEQKSWANITTMSLCPFRPWEKSMVMHIGKASDGWVFLFHGHQDTPFNSKAGWQKWLTDNNVRIVDEYGGVVEIENLFTCIELYYSPNGKNKQYLGHRITNGNTSEIYYCYNDDDGYTITMNKFS
jgi:hypothetical protein